MTITKILCSFSGRINRYEFWLKGWLILLPFSIPATLFLYEVDDDAIPLFAPVFFLAISLPGLAMAAKRLHDRGRSAIWLWTLLIPVVGLFFAIWITIEIWFLKGTDGPNDFGEAPPQPGGVTVWERLVFGIVVLAFAIVFAGIVWNVIRGENLPEFG